MYCNGTLLDVYKRQGWSAKRCRGGGAEAAVPRVGLESPLCDTGIAHHPKAGMAELADAADSKSADRKVMGVRFPLPAPIKSMI